MILAIAVIHSDRQGAHQLEQAIEMLSSQVKQIDLAGYRQVCADKERKLAEVRTEIAATDRSILEYATINLAPMNFRGETCLPMELSARIEGERRRHSWLPDQLSMGPAYKTQFKHADIAEARAIRKALGADIIYRADQLPDATLLPDIPNMLAAHEALARERDFDDRAAAGDLPDTILRRSRRGGGRALAADLA